MIKIIIIIIIIKITVKLVLMGRISGLFYLVVGSLSWYDSLLQCFYRLGNELLVRVWFKCDNTK